MYLCEKGRETGTWTWRERRSRSQNDAKDARPCVFLCLSPTALPLPDPSALRVSTKPSPAAAAVTRFDLFDPFAALFKPISFHPRPSVAPHLSLSLHTTRFRTPRPACPCESQLPALLTFPQICSWTPIRCHPSDLSSAAKPPATCRASHVFDPLVTSSA